MKLVTIKQEGVVYYWWFLNVFTTNRLRARKCTDCVAQVFVVNGYDLVLINENVMVEVLPEEFVIVDA